MEYSAATIAALLTWRRKRILRSLSTAASAVHARMPHSRGQLAPEKEPAAPRPRQYAFDDPPEPPTGTTILKHNQNQKLYLRHHITSNTASGLSSVTSTSIRLSQGDFDTRAMGVMSGE